MENQIKSIIGQFDFARVHKVMSHLNWQWRSIGVPSISEMEKASRELLEIAAGSQDKICHVHSGGFSARKDDNRLTLEFVVTRTPR